MLSLALQTYSQNDDKLVAFPTPEATSLGKYGQVPVSYFNGLPNISIPIYTLKCNDIELPISLSYYSSGNKPDEHPGWVGMGWNLNCGGMITRVQNGGRDDMDKNGFANQFSTSIPPSDPGYYYKANLFDIGDNWSSDILDGIHDRDLAYSISDLSPDEYLFNFNGISGSFYFVSENGVMTTKVKSKDGEILKVVPSFFSSNFNLYYFKVLQKQTTFMLNVNKTFNKFTVYTRDGYQYIFGGDESSIDFNTTNKVTVATSWHLTEIISPSGNYIKFSYTKGGDIFVQHKSILYTCDFLSENDGGCSNQELINNPEGLSINMLHPKYLSNISTSTGQTIDFITSKTTELDYNNWDYIKAYTPKIVKRVLMSDWEAENVSLLDFGFRFTEAEIKKVSYYLKLDAIQISGVKDVDFRYTDNSTERLKLLGIKTTYNNDSTDVYKFEYNSTKLPIYNSRKTDNWGYYNNVDYSNVAVTNYNTLYNLRTPSLDYAKAEILEKIIYPTKGYTEFNYELNSYSKYIEGINFNDKQEFSIINTENNINTGGLRIREIRSYPDPLDANNKIIKEFKYENENGKSSGILSGIPTYYTKGNEIVNYSTPDSKNWLFNLFKYKITVDYTLYYSIYSQNLIIPLSTTNGSHITYSRVVEKNSDGSKTIYFYTNHDDFKDEPPIDIFTNLTNLPFENNFTSKELERGLLKKIETYNSDGFLIKKTENTYNNDPDRYNNYVRMVDKYVLPVTNTSESSELNLYTGLYYRYTTNKIYTFYPYLQSSTETIYDTNGLNPVTTVTNYKYDSNYNLLTEKETYDSNNNTIVSKIKYPFDYTDQYPNINSAMKNRYLLNYPIENRTVMNGKIINGIGYTYGFFGENFVIKPYKKYQFSSTQPLSDTNLIIPLSYSLGGPTPFDEPDQSDEDNNLVSSESSRYSVNTNMVNSEIYDYYDNGNVRQVKNPNSNVNIVYLWSYNSQYPIAEITNATISEVESAVQTVFSISDIDTLLKLEIPNEAKLKDGSLQRALPNALATTYTYKPLVGMTSKTDPRGVTTYYEYDDFGRLKYSKDKDGNILQSYDYHYKQ